MHFTSGPGQSTGATQRLQVQSNIYFIKKLVAYHLVRLEDRRRKFIPANMYGYDTLTRRYPPERWEIVPDYTVDVGDERRPHVWLERDLPWSDWLEKRKLYMKPV